MTPRLFIRRAAHQDMGEAFAWTEGRSRGLGHEFLRAIRLVLATIRRTPEQYLIALDDLRTAPLRRFPQLVYYVAVPRGVPVIAVMHGRRDPRRWRSRR